MAFTTIRIDMEMKEFLDKLKLHPREPYSEVVRRVYPQLKLIFEDKQC